MAWSFEAIKRPTDAEEIRIIEENLAARTKGYDKGGVESLFRAVAVQAIKDYAKADKYVREGKDVRMYGLKPESIRMECKAYFKEPIFKHFFGFNNVDDVVKKCLEYQKIKDEIEEATKGVNNEIERRRIIRGILRKYKKRTDDLWDKEPE